ncbi:MAG TPA: TA system VapC family ribonuclease toxin [Thermoanaerobaculia bacterium]|nr:TA system VapC family ribonuclease toxin [Thermoanaerobaculia bacterium]
MLLCDSNVLLALTLSEHVHHGATRMWLDSVQEPESILICRATQQTFLRLLTNSSVLSAYGHQPLTNREAWSVYEALLADDRVVFQVDEPRGVDAVWKAFAARNTASPKLWMDAYLAALALTGGHQMVTTDGAFRQFRDLKLLVLGSS